MRETRTSRNSALIPSEGVSRGLNSMNIPQLVSVSLPLDLSSLPSHPERTDSSENFISCPIKWKRLERHFLLELAALSNTIFKNEKLPDIFPQTS